MKKKLNFTPVIIKAQKVIDSCETVEQLKVAGNYKNVVVKWMNKQIRKNGGLLKRPEDVNDSIDISIGLTNRIIKKMSEL